MRLATTAATFGALALALSLVACDDSPKVYQTGGSSAATAEKPAASHPETGPGSMREAMGDKPSALPPRDPAAAMPGRPSGGSDFSGVHIPLEFETPAGWVSEKPANEMRLRQYALPPVEGDKDAGSAVVFYFPKAGGSPERNIERWIGQMKTESGDPMDAHAKRASREVGQFLVYSVDMTGRYATADMTTGEQIDQSGTRFLGYVIETPDDYFFVKCLGPVATMNHWSGAIEEFIERACSPSRFAPRAGFVVQTPDNEMRKAQFGLPRAEGDAEDGSLVVFFFPGGAGSKQANVDRWVGQFTGADGQKVKDAARITDERIGEREVTFVDVSGSYTGAMRPGAEAPEALPGQRMIAAVIPDGSDAYYVRALGPAATVARWEADILAFVREAAAR
ncbi:MAG: hypothetical protein R3F20_04355 [Planctomycetota bacterium]